jgi:hypothetical protein
MTQRYDHHYPESLRDAVKALDSRITILSQLGEQEANPNSQVIENRQVGRRSSAVEQLIRNQ